MAETSPPASSRPPGQVTVAEVMEPALTTAQPADHVAAAAYLMKHAGATALVVLDAQTGRPIGIITDTDVAHVVADGKNVNEVRISEVMTPGPAVVGTATSVREAAELMTARRFRHLPVVDDSGLAGIVDISTISRALLGPGGQLPGQPALVAARPPSGEGPGRAAHAPSPAGIENHRMRLIAPGRRHDRRSGSRTKTDRWPPLS